MRDHAHLRLRLCHYIVASALVVSGCMQGPDYARPVVPVPSDYRFGDASAAAQGNARAWWDAFGDPTLNALVDEALASNRDLRVASARVDEYAAIVQGTQAQGRPQVGYGASASRQRTSEAGSAPFVGTANSSVGGVLTASWELDLWGRIARETEAARASLFATEEARRGVVLTVVSSVIVGYLNLLDLDAQLRIAEDTVAGRARSVELYGLRLSKGWISDFEMSLVRAEYEAALASLPELRRLRAQQETALSVLLGRNPGPIDRAPELERLALPTVPGGLPAELLARRPDILQAEQNLIASNAMIGAVRAQYFPRVSLTSLLGLASAALGGLFSGSARTWSFAGEVAGPIYTGGGLEAASDQVIARREQALAIYEQTVQNAFRDVEDALVSLQSARELEQSSRRRVEALEDAVRLSTERYDNGYADAIDVLDTERNLFSAQLALAGVQADRYRALVGLYNALGGDWIDEAAIFPTSSPTTGGNP